MDCSSRGLRAAKQMPSEPTSNTTGKRVSFAHNSDTACCCSQRALGHPGLPYPEEIADVGARTCRVASGPAARRRAWATPQSANLATRAPSSRVQAGELHHRHEFRVGLGAGMTDAFHAKKRKRHAGRCAMMPGIEVCVYCSHKIEEKEKSVNLPAGVAHLACAQKTTTRTRAS